MLFTLYFTIYANAYVPTILNFELKKHDCEQMRKGNGKFKAESSIQQYPKFSENLWKFFFIYSNSISKLSVTYYKQPKIQL